MAQLEARLSQPSDPQPEATPWLMSRLARNYLRLGRPGRAADLLNQALRLAAERELEPRIQVQLLGELGVAFLRLGEVNNCLEQHGPAMCIFPIAEGGRHRDPEPARLALRAFRGVLEAIPGQELVAWLANVAAMTAGEFPQGVAEADRVPAERLRSAADVGRFPDVAHEVGLAMEGLAGGAVVDDFDGDGRLDVVVSSLDPCAPLRFFRNDGTGRFEERSREAGLDGQLGGLNLVHADYDGDGDPDLLVLRGGWLGAQGRMRKSLLRNDGAGAGGQVTFSDVTFAAGSPRPPTRPRPPPGRTTTSTATSTSTSATRPRPPTSTTRARSGSARTTPSGERQVFTDVAMRRSYELREGEAELRGVDGPAGGKVPAPR